MPAVRRSRRIAELNREPMDEVEGSVSRSNLSRRNSEGTESLEPSDEDDDPLRVLEHSNGLEDSHFEGQECEIHMYQVRYDTRGERVRLQTGSRTEFAWENEPSHEAALVLTRFYTPLKVLESTRLAIQSPHMKRALREVVGRYPGTNINSKGPIYMFEEPRCLFHYQDELKEYAISADDEDLQRHVKFCLKYMSKILRAEISAYDSMMQNEAIKPGLEHRLLWMAFKPGDLLYSKIEGNDVILKLKEFQILKREALPDEWTVVAEDIICRGDTLGFLTRYNTIPNYDGYKALNELEVFPLQYHTKKEEIKEALIRRGRKYIALCGIHHKLYAGSIRCSSITLVAPEEKPRFQTKIVTHRVVLDSEKLDQGKPMPLGFNPGTKTIQINSDEIQHLSDEELLLCFCKLRGFSLVSKTWEYFDVDGITDIKFTENAFDNLVIAQNTKNLLFSLVKSPGNKTVPFDDFIEGKGKGIIFLLHGPPGVGKTFTAETISEYTQRPLYNIGCADLGGLPSRVETKLSEALFFATRWNAIVLLDEADVFMEERSSNELERNELVSVLLRTLEYFEGTMFLTTNRLGSIDPAFKSRIHLSLAYPQFSTDSKLKLWEKLILHGSSGAQHAWLNAEFLGKIAKEDVNGRQIKNIVRMAYSRAANGNRAMVPDDVLLGLEALKAFETDFNEGVKKSHPEGGQKESRSKRRKVA